ncbi:type II 3-dehydroquinate dehydratase [bacterium]|nr:type II 3-dehydroquinate dehydratase [bacterium]
MKILIVHGPNLDCLGKREKGYYGDMTLLELNKEIDKIANGLELEVSCIQSNCESTIVDAIHSAKTDFNGIIINPAGFGYSSISIRDALVYSKLPIIEVHLSNIHKRESFRHRTVVADICHGQISGFKESSYFLALRAMNSIFEDNVIFTE